MKVLDLRCDQGHSFEGWFTSEDDFRQQIDSGLLTCPLCGQTRITRLPSAPRLNLRGQSGGHHDGGNGVADTAENAQEQHPVATQTAETAPSTAMQAAWLHLVRRVLERTEDVGERFSQEARRIHYGEAPERGIRGKVSPAEAESLQAEGIAILPLPIPEGMDGPVQ
jgi:hypothetical protein